MTGCNCAPPLLQIRSARRWRAQVLWTSRLQCSVFPNYPKKMDFSVFFSFEQRKRKLPPKPVQVRNFSQNSDTPELRTHFQSPQVLLATDSTQLDNPASLELHGSDDMVIADRNNHRVQVCSLALPGSPCTTVAGWEGQGAGSQSA